MSRSGADDRLHHGRGVARLTATSRREVAILVVTAYIVLAGIGAAANLWAASTDFRRSSTAVANATKVEVPLSWLFPLGVLKAAGALGLLIGVAFPLIGVAAAGGLVLFFVCAVFAHLRVAWYSTLIFPAAFLCLAVGALTTRTLSW